MEMKNPSDSICFHCETCIAKTPCQDKYWCGWFCDECHCDVCIYAGKKGCKEGIEEIPVPEEYKKLGVVKWEIDHGGR